MGPIDVEAAYYHCRHCWRGHKPWERTLRLQQKVSFAPASEEIVALAGVLGSFADGRMAYVGMVYNPSSEHDPRRLPPRQVRYLSGFFELDALGRQLHREALQVGWACADQQIALSDGGSGRESFFKRFFPKAVCILDFFHAKEHLVELGQALYGADESGRQTWLTFFPLTFSLSLSQLLACGARSS